MPRKINRPDTGKTPSKVINGDGPTYVLDMLENLARY